MALINQKKFVVIETILCCGSKYTESVLRNLTNYFWEDVFKALSNRHQLNVDWDKSSSYHLSSAIQIYLLGVQVSFISHG